MSYATTTTTCALALAAALLAACDKTPSSPPKPQSSTTVAAAPAAANISTGIVSDASVPPASQVMNEGSAPAATDQDTAAAPPTGKLPKEEGAFESLVQRLAGEAR